MKNTLTFVSFAVLGTIVGFAYGQSVRKNADGSVTTDFSNGVATVTIDTLKLATGGLRDYFS